MRTGRPGTSLSDLAAGFLHLLWPSACTVCGRLGRTVCDSCFDFLIGTVQIFCLECGAPHPCATHADAPPCAALTAYGGRNRALVHRMKYGGAREIARRMGAAIGTRIVPPGADCVVPIPLHRDSTRDFNQAELIAAAAAAVWGVPVRDMLAWRAAVGRQATAPGRDDRALPARAIICGDGAAKGLRVVLVDDIYTTGATVRSARDALTEAGAIVSGAVVWARTGTSVAQGGMG